MFEANHGSFKASSAELTVPESVEIVKVDTARVSVQHLDWSDQYLQVRADVSDRRGEDNWYCISMREISDGTYSFMDGGPDIFISLDAPRHILDMDDLVPVPSGFVFQLVNVQWDLVYAFCGRVTCSPPGMMRALTSSFFPIF